MTLYVTTIVGTGTPGSPPFPASVAPLSFDADISGLSGSVIYDSTGALYFNVSNEIYKLNAAGTLCTLYAGNTADTSGYSGDGAAAVGAEMDDPQGMCIDGSDNLYIADLNNNVIRMVSHSTGFISTYNTLPAFANPRGICFDSTGAMLVACANLNQIYKIPPGGGVPVLYAGAGTAGYSGDGASATAAELNLPVNVSCDASDNVFIADFQNNVIRRVDHSILFISTYAGGGGSTGSGIPATTALLAVPFCIVAGGTLYIGDENISRLCAVDLGTGTLTTIAGTGAYGFSGDGGDALLATFNGWNGSAALAPSGDIAISDNGNNRLRLLSTLSPAPLLQPQALFMVPLLPLATLNSVWALYIQGTDRILYQASSATFGTFAPGTGGEQGLVINPPTLTTPTAGQPYHIAWLMKSDFAFHPVLTIGRWTYQAAHIDDIFTSTSSDLQLTSMAQVDDDTVWVGTEQTTGGLPNEAIYRFKTDGSALSTFGLSNNYKPLAILLVSGAVWVLCYWFDVDIFWTQQQPHILRLHPDGTSAGGDLTNSDLGPLLAGTGSGVATSYPALTGQPFGMCLVGGEIWATTVLYSQPNSGTTPSITSTQVVRMDTAAGTLGTMTIDISGGSVNNPTIGQPAVVGSEVWVPASWQDGGGTFHQRIVRFLTSGASAGADYSEDLGSGNQLQGLLAIPPIPVP